MRKSYGLRCTQTTSSLHWSQVTIWTSIACSRHSLSEHSEQVNQHQAWPAILNSQWEKMINIFLSWTLHWSAKMVKVHYDKLMVGIKIGIPRKFVVLESATSAMQKILSEIKFVNVSTVIRKLHCIVIYIILQQTNFAPQGHQCFLPGYRIWHENRIKTLNPWVCPAPLTQGLNIDRCINWELKQQSWWRLQKCCL